jgi:hypothetical protein
VTGQKAEIVATFAQPTRLKREHFDLMVPAFQAEGIRLGQTLTGPDQAGMSNLVPTFNDAAFVSYLDLFVSNPTAAWSWRKMAEDSGYADYVGTFIRVLGQDLGRRLGTVAMLDTLERTGSGKFNLDQCMTLGELERSEAARWSQLKCFVPLDQMLAAFPRVDLSASEARELRNGLIETVRMLAERSSAHPLAAAYDPEGHLAATFSNGKLDRVFLAPVDPSRPLVGASVSR